MNDKTIQLLEALAAKLGTTAEYLWGVLIKQASIDATTHLIIISVLAIMVMLYVKWLVNKLKDEDFDWDDHFGTQAIAIMMGAISFVGVLVMVKLIPGIVTGYMNPEYWALQKILEAIQ